jgi:hypothetical protein
VVVLLAVLSGVGALLDLVFTEEERRAVSRGGLGKTERS